MKIELTDNTKMHTAISLAGKHSFFDALCIFAQVDSYESVLNQIACLCDMDDVPFAMDLYRYAKQRYGAQYAVYQDVSDMDGVADAVLDFCEPFRAYAVKTDGTLRADKSMLITFGLADSDDDFIAPDLNYMADDDAFYNPRYAFNRIFDVKSEEYFDSLRINMERCYLDGDEAQAKKYAKRLLAVETDHLPTLEAQISLILYSEKYKNGIRYAERLANTQGGSHAAVGGAIEILMRTNPLKHLNELQKLLEKAVDLEEITLFDLEDYVYIASDLLHNYSMANTFAERLFSDYRVASLEALKVCACAFYNVGNTEKAKSAAITLLRVVPHDIFGRILLEFLQNETPEDVRVPIELSSRYIRHYFVPTKLTVFAQNSLIALLEKQGDAAVLDEKAFLYLSVIINSCKSLIITNRRTEYYDTATFVRAVLHTFLPKDNEQFFLFAKEQLFSVMSDQCINEYLVARMLTYGYCDTALVGLVNNTYYLLDFKSLCGNDEVFCYSFAICATLFALKNPAEYLSAYREIAQVVTFDVRDPLVTHKVAYAMLCKCRRGFEKSQEAAFFQEDEKQLYKDYIAKA